MQSSIKRKRILRTVEFVAIDAFSIFLTYALAIVLFMLVDIDMNMGHIFVVLPIIIAIKILLYFIFGLYRIMLSFIGFEDVLKIAALVVGSNVILFIVFSFINVDFIHPMAFVFIGPFEVALLVFPRTLKRLSVFLKTNMDWNKALGKRTLIIGAGQGGEMVMREVYKNKGLSNIPIAFVDDDLEKIGSRLLGIRVVGPIAKIREFIDDYRIEEVIIAIADMSLKQLQHIIEMVSEKNIGIKRLPLMAEIEAGKPHRIVDVKVEDLLNRDVIELDNEGIKDFIRGEVVLVTGGGGSIGSELCRQIANLKPKQLIIFDIYENNAYEIQMELIRRFQKKRKDLNLKVLIGSVYNEERLEHVFKTHKITRVFHAAAYKHVPLMEDSPQEAVRTNVIGTYTTAKLADKYGVKNFVLVSSDKAVRPTNVMGATKRFAELIIQKLNKESTHTKYAAVRFGNVLGSNGSVIPLFKKQIEDGGPLTVTHPDITRYFMTIPEAVGLILQCAVYAEGGEIFILDMGDPVKIKDLAEKMIRLAGYKPYKDIDIEFSGLRPGEKLYEELLVSHTDNINKTKNNKIFVEVKENGETLKNNDWHQFIKSVDHDDLKKLKKELKTYITSYVSTMKEEAKG